MDIFKQLQNICLTDIIYLNTTIANCKMWIRENITMRYTFNKIFEVIYNILWFRFANFIWRPKASNLEELFLEWTNDQKCWGTVAKWSAIVAIVLCNLSMPYIFVAQLICKFLHTQYNILKHQFFNFSCILIYFSLISEYILHLLFLISGDMVLNYCNWSTVEVINNYINII